MDLFQIDKHSTSVECLYIYRNIVYASLYATDCVAIGRIEGRLSSPSGLPAVVKQHADANRVLRTLTSIPSAEGIRVQSASTTIPDMSGIVVQANCPLIKAIIFNK